jgi:hypothetical protein
LSIAGHDTTLNINSVSIAVVWVRAIAVASIPIINSSTKIYDYIITFDDEVHVLIAVIPTTLSSIILKLEFLLGSRWGIVKMLYLLCRYLPFALIATDTYRELELISPVTLLKMF